MIRRKRGYVLYGGKAYHDKETHANPSVCGLRFVVDPKRNFVLRGGKGFLERSLGLYKNSPVLRRHAFKYWGKAVVEHVFGAGKQHKPPLRARN